ncbi:MAG TPA: hypothetical protein VJM06_00955 [Gaiellaceae bacterium]|nr:hypothetical protein [Gaiellaceae bacterium]
MTRGSDDFQAVGARVGAIAFLALVAGIVLGWSPLIPVAAALAGGLYGVELAISDAPLDAAAAGIAAALLLCTELAYWSREERTRWLGDPGDGLRRAAMVALLGAGAFFVSASLLALVDAVRARGLALDLLGAIAAVTVLATVLVAARGRQQGGSA